MLENVDIEFTKEINNDNGEKKEREKIRKIKRYIKNQIEEQHLRNVAKLNGTIADLNVDCVRP